MSDVFNFGMMVTTTKIQQDIHDTSTTLYVESYAII